MRGRLSCVASLLLLLLVGLAAANAATGGTLTSRWSQSSPARTSVSTTSRVPAAPVLNLAPKAPSGSVATSTSTSCVNDVCTVCVDGTCRSARAPGDVSRAVKEILPKELPKELRRGRCAS